MARTCGECIHFKRDEVFTCDGLAICSRLGLLENEDDPACSDFEKESQYREKQGGE